MAHLALFFGILASTLIAAPTPSKSVRREAYPPIEPYRTGTLKVSKLHEIYFEESGNPQGIPALFVHGGPGSGTSASQRRFFDPKAYRIILFDQRGAGKSKPQGELRENTTWDLVADIERLREHLGVKQWLVYGGSWGSLLALAYAEKHPTSVRQLIVRGVWLGRKAEAEWWFGKNAAVRYVYPDAWKKMVESIPADEQKDLEHAYYKRLTSPDRATQKAAYRAWSDFGNTTYKLTPDAPMAAADPMVEKDLNQMRIEFHYYVNRVFLQKEAQLLENVKNLKGIPLVIIQGRYDMTTPFFSAWDLHQAWPESELKIVYDAGHAGDEPGIVHELVTATDRFRPDPKD